MADLANYNINALLVALKDEYKFQDIDTNMLAQQELAKQIIINSIIATLKYKYFTNAWWVTVIGAGLATFTALIGWFVFIISKLKKT